ncbi:MAG: helix-turn-helix transcriptional regulator [Lachnospiraceae bacterium]|nr:helix-turn-helix transcriptional regulator [Lachnospiraceae bacterium]
MKNYISENIRKYRKIKGFTQEELALQLGVTAQAVSRWEAGVGMPDISLIVPIAQNLGVTTDTLFGMEDIEYDKLAVDKVKEQIDALYDENNKPESMVVICDYLKGEIEDNPTCYELFVLYLEKIAGISMYVDFNNFLKDSGDKWEKLRTDGIKKASIVMKHAKNRDLIDRVHWALAWVYIHEKDYDKAREHIEALPSVKSNRLQENIFSKLILFEGGFEKGMEKTKEIIEKEFEHYTKAIRSKIFYDFESYAYFADKESAVSFGDWSLGVMNALYARETLRKDMETFYGDWCFFMARTYLKAGDAEGAIAAYNKVKEHISSDKKEIILRKVKGACLEEVYHVFEREICR